MQRREPRILFVTDHCAGATAGYGLRVTNTVRGLRRIGPVTVVFLVRDVDDDQWPDELMPQADDPDYRLITMPATEELSRFGYVTTTVTGRPRDAVYRNRGQLVEQLRPLIHDHDLIWSFRARPFDAIGPIIETIDGPPPLVVDFDDLYDDFYLQPTEVPGQGGTMKRAVRACTSKLLSRQWRRHQHRVAEASSTVLVTHEGDRHRLQQQAGDLTGNRAIDGCVSSVVEVLPNGYPRSPSARRPVDRCTMIFVGGHHYGPNAQAARTLAHDVLPRVRAEIPEATLILVGRPGPITEQLTDSPGVRYLGFLDNLDSAFDDATVVCTPIRSGSGSRLKVLEALARRLPVVSTEFGCAGFDLEAGRHYLRADDPIALADAVVALHRDQELADRLVADAYAHYLGRFDEEAVQVKTAEIAARVLGHERRPNPAAVGLGS